MEQCKNENPSSVRSKKMLAEALVHLLDMRDMRDITISDITQEAGLSRRTFYTNFETKEDILDYCTMRLFDVYQEHLKTFSYEREADLLKDYLDFWYEHSQFLSILFKCQSGYLFLKRNSAFFKKDLDDISEAVAGRAKEVPYIRSYLSGLTFNLLWTWIVNDRDISMEELKAILDKLLEGRLF